MLERPQTQSSSARWIYVAVMGLAIAAGLGLALDRALGRGLEYDEIWSLKHYSLAPGAGRIFSDLGEPNNHTLHSLLTRWS